jgi:hypothetical protein
MRRDWGQSAATVEQHTKQATIEIFETCCRRTPQSRLKTLTVVRESTTTAIGDGKVASMDLKEQARQPTPKKTHVTEPLQPSAFAAHINNVPV